MLLLVSGTAERARSRYRVRHSCTREPVSGEQCSFNRRDIRAGFQRIAEFRSEMQRFESCRPASQSVSNASHMKIVKTARHSEVSQI